MNDDYSELLETYENTCKTKGNNDDNVEGMCIIAAFCAIGKWLRLELELAHIEVWRQSRTMAFHVIEDSYGLNDDQSNEANNAGNALAIGYHGENPDYFRGLMKDLGIAGVADRITPAGKSDLITLLHIFLAIVKTYEPADRVSKYAEDIEAICVHQLEGLTIKALSQELANQLFENHKDKLQELFPVPNLVENEDVIGIDDSTLAEIADIVGFTGWKKDK